MNVITGADLHDRQFTGYRGRWRYRTKVEFEAGGPLKTLFKRRYDAANFLADVRAFGVEKAMRELDNRGHRYGIDFKDAPTTQETADHAELAACPFCGGGAKQTGVRDGYVIYCVRCHAKAPPAYHGPKGWSETAERAASQWSRRASDQAALLSEIAALRGERDGLIEAAAARNSLLEITERQRDELRKALERIADEAPYRSGYCQSDVEYGPTLSADEMQAVARQALATLKAEGGK